MNRKIFKVQVHYETNMVVENSAQIEEEVKKHLYEHPERFTITSEFVMDCEDMDAWEVGK